MTDKIWAHVVDGVVREVIPLDAAEVPGETVYLPEFASALIDATKVKPQPAEGWIYDGKKFAPPELAAPTTTPQTTFDFLGFLELFTDAEQASIVSSENVKVKLFCLMAAGSNAVDLTDQRVIAGTNQLESLDLIGKGRAAQVLAGEAPSAS